MFTVLWVKVIEGKDSALTEDQTISITEAGQQLHNG